MSSSPGELELAFSTEPVVGWRVWRVCREIDGKRSARELAIELLAAELRGDAKPVSHLFRHRLRSLTELSFWPEQRAIEASCHARRHHQSVPVVGCQCGIWAFHSHEQAREAAVSYSNGATAVAVGRVRLWGRIVEHEYGWRAQYGCAIDATIYSGTDGMARDIADGYGIPVAIETPQSRRRAA
jgi:hypothetical protein